MCRQRHSGRLDGRALRSRLPWQQPASPAAPAPSQPRPIAMPGGYDGLYAVSAASVPRGPRHVTVRPPGLLRRPASSTSGPSASASVSGSDSGSLQPKPPSANTVIVGCAPVARRLPRHGSRRADRRSVWSSARRWRTRGTRRPGRTASVTTPCRRCRHRALRRRGADRTRRARCLAQQAPARRADRVRRGRGRRRGRTAAGGRPTSRADRGRR